MRVLVCVVGDVHNLCLKQEPQSNETSSQEIQEYEFNFYPRQMWNANPPKETTLLNISVPYVTIHDSYEPEACFDFETCAEAMRTLQRIHMEENNWTDIGYSFAVGSDGAIYEGRGFDTVASHAKYLNTISLGICLTGDWSNTSPPEDQLIATQALIDTGVRQGYIQPDYKLIGHRQVLEHSKCPGDALFSEIKSWTHYSHFPAATKELIDVKGIPKDVKDIIQHRTPIVRMKVINKAKSRKSKNTMDFMASLKVLLAKYALI